MANGNSHSGDGQSTRDEILSKINPDDYVWTLPFMHAGYAGRGLVYLVVASVSLWSIWQGSRAEGTKGAMDTLDGWVGLAAVTLIAAGMFGYAIWRGIDSFWDMEAHGSSAKGILARIGMLVTSIVHAGIGILALASLSGRKSGGEGQSLVSTLMQSETGPWLIGATGVGTMCVGIHYGYKGVSQSYRDNLMANHFTTYWNPILRAGLIAQGISIVIIGALILYAAVKVDASQAGGLGSAFDWLHAQSYGKILVVTLCLGLLCFSLFCFVNAVFRIVPRAADKSVENLTSYFEK